MTNGQQQTVRQVARRALVFGEESARHIGEEPFRDPVLHAYFLLYVLGAVDYLGDNPETGTPLVAAEKLAAMAEALAAFDVASPDEIRATVLLLSRASQSAALAIKAAGAKAAERWQLGNDQEATRHFQELMGDPQNLPRNIDPVLRPLIGG